MQLSAARQEYVRWLVATRDLSPNTVRAYESDLLALERHIGSRACVDHVDRNLLVAFLEEQRESGLLSKTIRRRSSGLRGFFRWLVCSGLLAHDPAAEITVAGGRSGRLPRTLATHELDRLLVFLRQRAGVTADCEADQLCRRPFESTTLLAVALMVSTGVRVAEVVGIKCEDLDLSCRSVRLLGKGRRERNVFLTNDWITDLTRAYLEIRRGLRLEHPRLLFNRHHDPLTAPAVRSRVANAAREAGLSDHVTPHMLRHTAATQLIEAGVDIRYIQRLLGHASLSTTEIYTHVSNRALKRAVSNADVLGRLLEPR